MNKRVVQQEDLGQHIRTPAFTGFDQPVYLGRLMLKGNCLCRDGSCYKRLSHRQLSLLSILYLNRGKIVSYDDIIWHIQIQGRNIQKLRANLSTRVRELQSYLCYDSSVLLEAVQKTGYRLITPEGPPLQMSSSRKQHKQVIDKSKNKGRPVFSTNTTLYKEDIAEDSLLMRLRKGDEEAFCKIFEKYRATLYLEAYYLLKDSEEARDAVQEFFLWLWTRKAGLKEGVNLKSYLFKAIKNTCIDILRHKNPFMNLTSNIHM